ncbi:hypothetical protein [Clostridium luticellarii]|jgi:hypothetical protein|uniref:Uncharacterized protein n=1 Tax=Clostridium luticellarii TaxID=1691940 RepID=A0A2T0BI31_9CLOT|nr:hypothetical protein [Clostridium luticellarii]MCI1945973.1 hypothetical protein [Clostridium luticellarii]MCI1969670.1 hypothetical protein [Clostridium luticellarii]MCI1996659.1 hypothetical protein [Clostridium luticellarii]MCI2039585.1 hypothetical protein [Clostridium luticellarii]PRR83503.1 hypothetical protein CLLU_26340 [Clostridium luticellarii]
MPKSTPDKTKDIKQKKGKNTHPIGNSDFESKTHWKVYSSEKGYQICGRDTHSDQ